MTKDGEPKERKLRYYQKTVQLLTVVLEVFFLFFVAAVIFLFVATDDATRFEAENQQLLTTQANLQNRVSQLESQVIATHESSLSTLGDGELTRFFLLDNEPFSVSVSLNDTLKQTKAGYERRELIEEVVIPLHARYAQTAYDFALYTQASNDDIADLREYYSQELLSVQSKGPTYLVLPLGATEKTVMDFRDYVDPTGFEEEMLQLRAQYSADAKFIEALWKVVSQMTTYSREIEETPLYPLETLLLGGGDCEDSVILFASMLDSLDHDWQVSFIYTDINNPGQPMEFNHILVHIDTGVEEFFVETTSTQVMNPYSLVVGEYILLE